jgi:hypothetical protein
MRFEAGRVRCDFLDWLARVTIVKPITLNESIGKKVHKTTFHLLLSDFVCLDAFHPNNPKGIMLMTKGDKSSYPPRTVNLTDIAHQDTTTN